MSAKDPANEYIKKAAKRWKRPDTKLGDIFRRAERDGTRSRKINIYPTENELIKAKAIAYKMRYKSVSQVFTEAIRNFPLDFVSYDLKVPGDLAEKAEKIAVELGYTNAEEWLTESVINGIEVEWAEKPK